MQLTDVRQSEFRIELLFLLLSGIHLMYSPSPPQLPQLLCCRCALRTSLGGPGGPMHDVHGHVVFSPVVHGTGYKRDTVCY
jgi:hypothetical protein